MHKLQAICFLLLCSLLSGCLITNTAGFHSGYKKLTPEQKSQVVFVDTNRLATLPPYQDNQLLAITASHLDHLLENNDTSVVYVWKPHCHATSCLPLSTVYDYCQRHNYKLYVVLEYYSDLENTQAQLAERYHVFGINYKYYHSDYCPTYVKRFVKQLVKGRSIPKSENYFRYYFFKRNHYIWSKEQLIG